MDKNIIQYYIDRIETRGAIAVAKTSDVNARSRDADKRIHYCKKGKHTWEYVSLNYNTGAIYKYFNIPTLGKKILDCNECT